MDHLKGTEIVGYKLVELIGAGGMASVWRGDHPTLGRQVAVKVMDPGLARNSGLVARFVDEAKLQVNLRHPNIVGVENFSLDPLAIVMEFVQGQPLAALVGKGKRPLALEQALPLMRQIMDAVGFAHGRGVVHRDLKPANVMVTSEGQAKVVDFGIAKVLDVHGRTRTGTTMGTPAYMAPEQIMAAKDADHRADIYALAVTFYEVLAGRTPFVDAADTTSDYQIMDAQMRLPPPDPREFQPGINEGVAAALLIALAKDPEERFQSVEALRVALEQAALGAVGGEVVGGEAVGVAGQHDAALAPTLGPEQAPPAVLTGPPPPATLPTPTPTPTPTPAPTPTPRPALTPTPSLTPTPAPTAAQGSRRGPMLGLGIGLGAGLTLTLLVIVVVVLASRGEDEPIRPAAAIKVSVPPRTTVPQGRVAIRTSRAQVVVNVASTASSTPDAAVDVDAGAPVPPPAIEAGPTRARPWVIVARSPEMTPAGRQVAYKHKARLRVAGFSRVAVLDGRRFPNFRCCFWVVVVDAFATRAEAAAEARKCKAAGFRVYVKNAFKGRFSVGGQ